jgi:hypothetical protein
MNRFDIEVDGAPPPHKPNRIWLFIQRVGRTVRAVLMRPRAVALASLTAFVLLFGTPHVGWDYRCAHPQRFGEPCRAAIYCAYYGVQGRRVVIPDYGKACRPFTFVPLDFQQFL